MINIKALVKVFHKHKSYTAINIFGLSVGFALLMVIVLLLRFELSYDKHWNGSENIYRIDSKFLQGNNVDQLALTSKLLPERLSKLLPEAVGYARFSRPRNISVKVENQLFSEDRILYSDNNSLELFQLDFLVGDSEELLENPQDLIISDELAIKWFGSLAEALDGTVRIKNNYFTVKGIFNAIPKNSHLRFDALMSYRTVMEKYEAYDLKELNTNIWIPDAYCYIKLANRDKDEVQQKIQAFIDENVYPLIAASGSNEILEPQLIELEQTHFSTGSSFDPAKGNIAFIKTTSIIAIVILLIICINYANLGMSILVQRHKELGMRRLLGASRAELITQIITESFISVAIGFGLGLVWLFIIDQTISFEFLTGRSIDYQMIFHANNFLLGLGGMLIITLLSSFYPALVFSKTNIIAVKESKREGNMVTNLMIGVQFVASFMVISSMFLMEYQMSMLSAFDLGITDEPVISIEVGESSTPDKVQLVKSQLANEPGIEMVTDAIVKKEELIAIYHINATVLDKKKEQIETAFSVGFVGQDYCEVFDIQLLDGRDFRKNSIEHNSVLVNQRFADRYYQGEAVGKSIFFREQRYTIIGVVKNFYYRSLREDLEAMAIFPKHVYANDLVAPIETSFQIRIDDFNPERTLKNISKVFATSYPNFPFSYQFISEKVDAFYQEDEKNTTLTGILGFSAIIIAIFGLVGLVSFEINQRRKEISIRKVLGAKPQTLFLVISKKQLILLSIACLISIPATYYFISDWLNDFSFTIDLGSSLLIATLTSLLIVISFVLLAMTFKFIEVLNINPVKNLRHD